MTKIDYYEVLKITETATEEEIKQAYRNKAKKHHPDLNPDNEEAEAKFKEANEAYEVLSDPEKRSRYDRFGHDGVDPQAGGFGGGGGFGGFEDIFDIFDIFGGGSSGGQRRQGPTRGADLRYDVNLEFKEAVFGVEKEVKVQRDEECSTCNGSGAQPGTEKETCSTCNGQGEVEYVQNTPFGQFARIGTCEECEGTGEIIIDKCDTCNGRGKETKIKTIKVNIPAGVDNGSVISMRGEGEAGDKGGPSGDLYIYINVKEDPLFKRSGMNVFLDVPISFTEAALGAEIEVPTLDGKTKYNIPEGTQTGTEFKLKEKGIANVRGHGKGNLYFTVNIEVPTKLTEKQKEVLKDFAESNGEKFKENKKGFFGKVKDVFN